MTDFLRFGEPIALVAMFALVIAPLAQARVIAIDIDLPIDQVSPQQQGIKIGDHHRARVFYDTSMVDRKTGIVKPLHMQHMVGSQWTPIRLDPAQMPMTDSWLDTSQKPYRFHYHSAVVEMGEAVIVDFDGPNARMSIRRQSDGSIIVAAPCVVDSAPVADANAFTLTAAPPSVVMHEVSVLLDEVAPSQTAMFKPGNTDRVRVVYDASLVDPKTRRVKLANMQHFIGGRFMPERADPVFMPTNDAWIDLSRKPYRLHFHAAVTHGVPIIIDADEKTQRLSIRSQADPKGVLISGKYTIDVRPLTGPEADAAAARAPF